MDELERFPFARPNHIRNDNLYYHENIESNQSNSEFFMQSQQKKSIEHYHMDLSDPVRTPLCRHTSSNCFSTTQLAAKLTTGGIFKIFDRHNPPHYCFIWVSSNYSELFCSDIYKRKIYNKLLTSALQDVALIVDNTKNCKLRLVFLQCTLDLEALHMHERNTWYQAFQFLIDLVKKTVTAYSEMFCDNQTSIVQQPTEMSVVASAGKHSMINSDKYMNVDSDCDRQSDFEKDAAHTSSIETCSAIGNSSRNEPMYESIAEFMQSDQQQHPLLENVKKYADQMKKQVKQYRDKNRKLLINSSKQLISIQEKIDKLLYDNETLRQALRHAGTDEHARTSTFRT